MLSSLGIVSCSNVSFQVNTELSKSRCEVRAHELGVCRPTPEKPPSPQTISHAQLNPFPSGMSKTLCPTCGGAMLSAVDTLKRVGGAGSWAQGSMTLMN